MGADLLGRWLRKMRIWGGEGVRFETKGRAAFEEMHCKRL
jgi:hypothetical protein